VSTQATTAMSLPVIAHHEAGHAVAGMVLGVEFREVRIVPAEDGRIGVPLKTTPWLPARPATNPGEFTDDEWKELSRSSEKWEAWKKKDNDSYAIFCFAGKAAQIEFAGSASDEDAKADYSFVERKRLTNTPVRQAGSVLKCPDDRKNRVVSAQATYPCGSSAVGGRVCEQRYAAERVLPESRFELQHTGSPSKETALEEKA